MPDIYANIKESVPAMDRALDAGKGVVRLAPAWVPRLFCTPGRRIRLHPDDYFSFGQDRGGIDERWLASSVRAENGPQTTANEGLSLVIDPDGGLVPFDSFVDHHRGSLLGADFWAKHQSWPMYSKFFDNQQPLPFHMHQLDKDAALVGKRGKPEAYYYAPEMNNHIGDQPIAFFGLRPDVTKDQLREKIAAFANGGDNCITELALGYRLKLGTGWDIPAGILHAPPSVCTYEPQVASDVFSMWESWSNNREVPPDLVWKDVPAEHHGDYEYLMEQLDWEANIDPNFAKNRYCPPVLTGRSRSKADAGWQESWITYKSQCFSAKELRVAPGAEVTLSEAAAFGAIVVAGQGQIADLTVAAATLIRFGALSSDEVFVSHAAASAGLRIRNLSATDTLVILKHFGPDHPDLTTDRAAGIV